MSTDPEPIAFVERLLDLPAATALADLQRRVGELDDPGFDALAGLLARRAGAESQRVERLRAQPGPELEAARARLDVLISLMSNAASFRDQHRIAAWAAQVQPLLDSPPAGLPEGADAGLAQLLELARTATGTDFPRMLLHATPEERLQMLPMLQALGAGEVGAGSSGSIDLYFRPGTEKYTLRWPLSPDLPLPLAFEELDRRTQFHVLFGEFSRREMEGGMLRNEGRLDEAEEVARECLERAAQLDVPHLRAKAHQLGADIAQKRGDRAAEGRCLRAALAETDLASADARELRRSVAMIDFEEGRLPEAAAALSALIAEYGEPADNLEKRRLCSCLTDRATVYRFAHRWREAVQDLARAEEIAGSLKLLGRQATLETALFLRGKLHSDRHSPLFDPREVERYLDRMRELGSTSFGVDLLEADLATQRRDWKRAARLHEGVVATTEEQGFLRGAAGARLRAAEAHLQAGADGEAARALAPALDFLGASGPPDLLASARMVAARVAAAQGRVEDGWQLALQSLNGVEEGIRHFRSPIDQQRFMVDKLESYQHAFAIGLAAGGEAGCWRAWAVAERAKGFYLCQLVANANVGLFEGVDPARLAELRGLEDELDAAEGMHGRLPQFDDAARAACEAQIESLSAARHRLLAAIMQDNPRWGAVRVPAPLDLEAELRRLDPRWTPLGYYWQPRGDGSVLHLFHADAARGPRHRTVEWSAAELRELEEAEKLLSGSLDPGAELLSPALTAKILPPGLLDELPAGSRLLVSPHGALQAIPLHALRLPGGGCLIERAPVQYLPTFALLPWSAPPRESDGRVLLVGCEQDDFGGARLIDVPDEIGALRALWSAARPGRVVDRLVPRTGTLEAEGLPPERWGGFDVLHFACHGVFPAERPLDAALRLGREAVRVSELFATRLDARVVILSACSLAARSRGDGEVRFAGDAWLGIYLPLFYAGARTLLVSLWEANSLMAQEFMASFHGGLAPAGADPADAFREALLPLASLPPSFWANWYPVWLPDSPSTQEHAHGLAQHRPR